MEICFIKVVNREPEGHPIADWNLRMFYPNLDPNNPPEGFEKFIRIAPPNLGPFDKSVESRYARINGILQDVHTIIPMTDEEKKEKIKITRRLFPCIGWTLNEQTLEWVPPIPYPSDGQQYIWDNTTQNWTVKIEEQE